MSSEKLEAAELLNSLEHRLRSSAPLVRGNPRGRIESQNRHRSGRRADGVGKYHPSRDRPQAINVGATVSTGIAHANKKRSIETPKSIFLLADYGSRYYASGPQHRLREVARLAVAVASLSAEKGHSAFRMVVAGQETEPKVFDDFRRPFQAIDALSDYDEYTEAAPSIGKRQTPSTLVDGLEVFTSGELTINPDNDVLIVSSDFFSDQVREQKGKRTELTGFAWEDDLRDLDSQLLGRLMVVRMTSDAQTALSLNRHLTDGQQGYSMNMTSWMDSAINYHRQGSEAAGRIAEVLSMFDRTVNLDASDPTPDDTLLSFMYEPLTRAA